MTDYHHGVKVLEISEGTRPIRTVSTAVIGLIATASDADADFYPENQPVLVTNVQAAIGKAGKKAHWRRPCKQSLTKPMQLPSLCAYHKAKTKARKHRLWSAVQKAAHTQA